MIDRTIEATLLLSGVQLDRQTAVCTGGVEQIEKQTGGDGLTTAVLLPGASSRGRAPPR